MASPQLENGHTQIANELLEHLMMLHLPPNQWQVLLCIIRKTYGYHKKVDYIANSQIAQATGINKTHVSRAMACLEKRNLIIRKVKQVEFQKDWESWDKLPILATKLPELVTKVTNIGNNNNGEKLPILEKKLPILEQKVTSPRVTQKIKDTIQKKYIKEVDILLPEWIDKEHWSAFLEVRKLRKAPNTEFALKLIVNKLDRLKTGGENPKEILEKSIIGGWAGVFGEDERFSKKRQPPAQNIGEDGWQK